MPPEIEDLITRSQKCRVVRLWPCPGQEQNLINLLPKIIPTLLESGVDEVQVWIAEQHKFTPYPVALLPEMQPEDPPT